MQWCYNIDVSLEEGKIRELTGKELVEDRVGLIIKSLVNLCEIISSFLFFVLCYVKELRVLYLHQKYTMAFSSNSKLVFIIILKSAGFYMFFFYIQNNIPQFLVLPSKQLLWKCYSRLNAYCHVSNYGGVKFYF